VAAGALPGAGCIPTFDIAWRGPVFGPLHRQIYRRRLEQGSDDAMIPTYHSLTLQHELPDAQLIVYPDSGNGSIYQYPELFLTHATLFLDA
jgi:hypothetical protein